MTTEHIDSARHPITDPGYQKRCRAELERAGALVLEGFFEPSAIAEVVADFVGRSDEAFYASTTHNVYLTARDPNLADDHAFNRQVASSKGLLADDRIDEGSPLKAIYADESFRRFLCSVLDIDSIHPYADALSSVNVHFAAAGQELGWHFDNSSFAVTMLLRAPECGGCFEYVAAARNADAPEAASDEERFGYERVAAVLDGTVPVERLSFAPGDLVLFRGRNALHRVTPTGGGTTRMLAVLAYNDEPGIGLSESALKTFYGRDCT